MLHELEKELKSLQHRFHTNALSKGAIFAKKANFLRGNAKISKIVSTLVLKSIFSENTHKLVFTYQNSSLYHKSKQF